MKKLEEFFIPEMSEELKTKFVEAVKADKVNEFFVEQGVDATVDDFIAFAKKKATESGKLSDEQLEAVAGGSVGSDIIWGLTSLTSFGVTCAVSGIMEAGKGCPLDLK